MGSKYLFLSYAVTPVHVGTGRSPGVVDLPFQRDSMGYPIIYGSSFKGVLKSHLLQKNKKDLATCVFGSETEDTSNMGKFILTDLIPILYPTASLNEGYVYITTEYLINRVEDLLSVLECDFKSLYKEDNEDKSKSISVLLGSVSSKKVLTLTDEIRNLGKLIREKSYVLDNEIGLQLVESSLIRVTRNVLVDKTKKSNNIWTEEYIPHGTILIGGVIDGDRENSVCEDLIKSGNDVAKQFLENFNNKAVFIGGKETIGKGLIKMKVIECKKS
ncbi:type III-B CRISPR module RAMP protein Cmr4 [Sulfolobus sp. E3]|nr:type III-B CRISPR module RAMP protein Cmr4 [Sulfolobus sp. E3]